MALIDGIGGAFVFSNNCQRLAGWYRTRLGFEFEGSAEFGAFYQMFLALHPEDGERRMDTTFSIMRAKAGLPPRELTEEPDEVFGDQPFMVNLRVQDLDAVLAHLTELGVEPIRRTDEGYGLFAWVRDGDGNRVELYQPVPSVDPAAESE